MGVSSRNQPKPRNAMKNHSVFLGILTATLFAAPVFAADETAATASALERKHRPNREEMLQRFDSNHDGKLDDGEREAARAEWKKQAQEPGARHGRARGERRQKLLQRFDADHDGKLSDTEKAAAKQTGRKHAKIKDRRQELLERFDRDGNGRLNESERTEAKKAWDDFLQQHPKLAPAAKAS
jgi:hypothetical protein